MRNPQVFNRIFIILSLILAIVVIVSTQFAIPTLYGTDGYLHIRMADFIKKSGPIRDFHWARFSTFSNFFADKSFLYHLILIPFTFGNNLILGAKLSACFFAILFLIIFLIILGKYAIRPLIPIFIVGALLSERFLCALSIPRPMIFAIALSLLGIYFLIERKLWGIFIVTFIYCLSHISGPSILIYALLTETVGFFSRRKFYIESIAVVLLSILLSYLVHPNFPNNFLVFYLNAILVPVYAIRGVFGMGGELLPLTTKQLLFSYPLMIIGLMVLLFLAVFFRPKTRFATRVIFVHSALFLSLSFLSHRYVIHTYPFILLLLASYISDYFQDNSGLKVYQKNKIVGGISIAVVCFSVFLLGWKTYIDVRNYASVFEKRNSHYEKVGYWMRENIPAGELIYHANWSDSQFFIGLNPGDDYFVTLHPIYMYWGMPDIYDLYTDLSRGRTIDPYYILRYIFRVKYGYSGKGFGLFDQIRNDLRFKILYDDKLGIVFKLV